MFFFKVYFENHVFSSHRFKVKALYEKFEQMSMVELEPATLIMLFNFDTLLTEISNMQLTVVLISVFSLLSNVCMYMWLELPPEIILNISLKKKKIKHIK